MITQPRRPASIPLLVLAPIATMLALLAMSAWLVSAPRVRAAETVTVDISNFTFDPGTVTIQVGDTVTWTTTTRCPIPRPARTQATFDGEHAAG